MKNLFWLKTTYHCGEEVRYKKFYGYVKYTPHDFCYISALMPFNVIIRLAIKMYNFVKYGR